MLKLEFEQGTAFRKDGAVRSGVSAIMDLQMALQFMIAFLANLANAFRNGSHWDAAARMRTYEVCPTISTLWSLNS